MISIKSARTRLLATLAVGAAAGATLLVPPAAQAAGTATTAGTANTAATSATAVSSVLKPGEYLKPGQYRRSPNGIYTLIMQTDGNAVLYKGRTALWGSMTNRKASSLIMQRDGNLVVISGRTPVWASNTGGSTGAYLAVQNDSNLVIYNVRNKAVWYRHMVIGTLGSGRLLNPYDMLFSPSRVFRLQMQTDGNLVMVKNGKTPVWSTRTAGKGAFAVMQQDGNFVVYSAAKKALWSSKTVRKGSVLQMRDDGRLVIVYGRTAVWSTSAH
ncbi:hypothetical protein [Kribbella pratensis]|uniref:D-mannose binding lectin n=1 Tax=Kribbella pratensis TaxID=2512112 RepID=A0A4R8C6E1_9ACTN|nr:hypothetical protein [Kribbella pratensis]TDW70765.1 D-mannose binding lectin [Kribbella pratensis]